MFKRNFLVFTLVFCLFLTSCVSKAAGLLPYSDIKDGYSFLYPGGWQQKMLKGGPDVLFQDIIELSENVSVVIGQLNSVKQLAEIGTASDVGLRLAQKVIAPPESGRSAELITAEQRENKGKTYYLLEYATRLANGSKRHDLVSVTTGKSGLYTMSVSTPESRWPRVKELFYRVAESFTVR
ncbi:MAG: photosystem II reaction center PsbP [Pseudanabaenaceae cyanobacterium bins.68]|nr:photosystem II reaction center PsbP [Pseudanabaenaceae cyanobacterium bins.68]